MRYGFYFDADRCIGCKTFVMACKDVHDLPAGVSYRRVYNVSSGHWETDENGTPIPVGVHSYSISAACNHCKEPACIRVCPQRAIQKDENGIVWIDHNKCVGCRLCAGKCPHGAIQFNRGMGVSEKCDMCRMNLKEHKDPACVAACPMRCLKIVDLDSFIPSDKERCVEFPIGSVTQPSVIMHLNRRSDPRTDRETMKVINMQEEL